MHTRNPWTVTKPLFIVLSILTLLTAGPLWAEEIRLTTYYPSPFGEYDQLESNNLVVYGDVLLATVAGRVGIGTTSPIDLVEVAKDQLGTTTLRIENRRTIADGSDISIDFGGYRDVDPDYIVGQIFLDQSRGGRSEEWRGLGMKRTERG